MSNTARGTEFHQRARRALEAATGFHFESEVALPLGNPPRPHRFDLATADRLYVGEAKAVRWTASGNVPSAKITNLREATQFLGLLPNSSNGFIVMLRNLHPKSKQSLADYFVRLNGHLLGRIAVIELNPDDTLRFVYGSLPSIG